MKITGETKFFIGIIIFTVILIIGAAFIFSRPAPLLTRADLIPEGTNATGSASVKNFLVEFSDFQCPACKTYKEQVDIVEEKYPDKIYIAYRHFPLNQHPLAQKAALAAEAAGEQGKFWNMYDLLFDNQDALSEEKISELAKSLNLDMGKFDLSLNNSKYSDKIQSDISYGNRIGLNATPTFYLNGRKLDLFKPEDLLKEVEKEVNL